MTLNNVLKVCKINIKIVLSRLFNQSFFSKIIGVAICSNKAKYKRADYVFDFDIIRSSSLELVSIEIYDNKIEGNVAELGVYRGGFAEKINMAFPDRKLYLFDTFEGSDKNDEEIERVMNHKEGERAITDGRHYIKTSEEIVLQRMKFRENCIVRKGYFPETANGIEDKFVFVSIDVGLYQPVYNGLKYFYPRLVKGGYIFITAYSNDVYCGARQAIKEYCKEEGITLFPLSDLCSSAIIIK
jgi:O-methyltransferase